jgi:hypothetical protein
VSPSPPITPDRLFQAVDAIYAASGELGGRTFEARPSKLMGRLDQPRAFCDFTVHEIEEAERFLFRCGLLRGTPDRPETMR